jgi:precorrin-8X/cobalt-precorrin-8 methylmutase
MDAARGELQGCIMAIGNAPTALIRLMEHLEAGGQAPALIIGMPVGFVNAAESKELLVGQIAVPYITIRGRKGGSPLAAATVNALAEMALRK